VRRRVLVAMSGGVDSSVAAAVLVEQGYDVVGATMKLFCHGEDLPDRPCCSLDSVNDARRVCERLGIPHYVLNLEPAFSRDVVGDFVGEYARGRTPIPCVQCNTHTKFRDLVAKADGIDAEWIATGHYARVEAGVLRRGADRAKDQSYFMWGVEPAVLRRLLLPVGTLTKAETRGRARDLGLSLVADKIESQDICFVPHGDHTRVIAERLGADAPALQPGPIVTTDGRPLGEHGGYARYTVGQRRGLPGGASHALYVVAIRPEERTVVVGTREELLGRGLVARRLNWLAETPPHVGQRVLAQIRHRGVCVAAELVRLDAEIELALEEPLSAITPGQSVVLYEGDTVLGGAIIEQTGARQLGRHALPLAVA
jgi:tRNA-uridine 2-sulfurtransferase